MQFNAILPTETCYELYTYRTSGLPVNCYGRRYINNRIQELQGASGLPPEDDGAATSQAQTGADPAG